MQKGYKRTGKAIAVLHFFIGLILVAIFLIAAYFCLEKMDYSHRINPDTTVRPYVEMTASPDSFDQGDPMGDPNAGVVDLTPTATPTAEPTPEVTATPEPTPIPTPSPEPTATPTPSPEPTQIPSDRVSQNRPFNGNTPPAFTNAMADITKFYVSAPNNNAYVEISGYCYINDPSFNGEGAQAFLVVTHPRIGSRRVYLATMVPGISGVTHDDAACQNADGTDFDAVLNVADYPDGEYKLGLVLGYNLNGKTTYSYYEFDQTLTVQNRAAVQPTESFANAAAEASEVAEDGEVVEGGEDVAPEDAEDAEDVDFADVEPAEGSSTSVG